MVVWIVVAPDSIDKNGPSLALRGEFKGVCPIVALKIDWVIIQED